MRRVNFIIPESLKSQKITILSPTKITAAEAWPQTWEPRPAPSPA